MDISMPGIVPDARLISAAGFPGTQGSIGKKISTEQTIDAQPEANRENEPKPDELSQVEKPRIEFENEAFNKRLQLVVDYQTQEVVVKVIDKETDEVINVIPLEGFQRLNRRLKETIGSLFNETI
jgi:flagellar protein FlaG